MTDLTLSLSRSEREMLKAIYRLSKDGADAHTGALAEHLGVAPATATASVKRLAERGFVDHRPYRGVELTGPGRFAAVAAIRRHRIVERFLSDICGYAWHEADRLAATFEHELPQEVEDRLFGALGHPTTCPHGFPIPEAQGDRIPQMPSLDDLAVGDGGVIALSGSTNPEVLEFLESLGVRPGVRVEVLGRHPFSGPVVVAVDGREQTVGERIARQIFVQLVRLVPGSESASPSDPEAAPGPLPMSVRPPATSHPGNPMSTRDNPKPTTPRPTPTQKEQSAS